MPGALQFDEATHTYTVDGVEYPSVTTILKDAGLIDTSQPWYTEWHRDRGTQVHKALELFDQGDLDEESLDPEIRPYVDAWEKFLAESRCGIEQIEVRCWNKAKRYAGTIDRVLKWGPGVTICDIKCGPRAAWHGLQTAAYGEFIHGRVPYRCCVHLSADGKFSVSEHKDRTDYDAWASALYLYHWKRNNA